MFLFGGRIWRDMQRRFVLVAALAIVSGFVYSANNLAAAPADTYAVQPSVVLQSVEPSSISPTPMPQQAVTVRTATAASKPPVSVVGGNALSIPSIRFQGQIVDVGLTQDNAIDVPTGLQVGRWNGSAIPGSPGAVFLDGHVDGIFARLHQVAAGQTLSIDYNGQKYSYRVVYTETVLLDGIDMTKALSTYGGVSEGLNIMTCAGNYMPSHGTYDQRLVVYAVRIA